MPTAGARGGTVPAYAGAALVCGARALLRQHAAAAPPRCCTQSSVVRIDRAPPPALRRRGCPFAPCAPVLRSSVRAHRARTTKPCFCAITPLRKLRGVFDTKAGVLCSPFGRPRAGVRCCTALGEVRPGTSPPSAPRGFYPECTRALRGTPRPGFAKLRRCFFCVI